MALTFKYRKSSEWEYEVMLENTGAPVLIATIHYTEIPVDLLFFFFFFPRLLWLNSDVEAAIPWLWVSKGGKWLALLRGAEEWWPSEGPRGLLR